jgi:hypothetical protein
VEIKEVLMDEPVIVSYSELFKYQTCRRQYYYRFILGLSPIEENNAISTGVKGHKLLQNFHQYLSEGKTKDEARQLVLVSANKLLNAEGRADFSLLSSWTLVDNYIASTDFTAKAILIENRFLLPVSLLSDDNELAHVQIGFTPDVVFERKGDFLDVEDYKFIQRAWPKSKVNRYQQSKLYQIFLKRMGYNVSRSTIRFFNVKTAQITEQNYTLGAAEEETILRDFLAGVKEVVEFKANAQYAPRTMNYTACQFCQFEFPCTLEAEGKDASKTLNSQYQKSSYDYSK